MFKQSIQVALMAVFTISAAYACPFTFKNDGKVDIILSDIVKKTQQVIPAGQELFIPGAITEFNIWIYVQRGTGSSVFDAKYGIDESECVVGDAPTLIFSALEELSKSDELFKGFNIIPFVAEEDTDIPATLTK